MKGRVIRLTALAIMTCTPVSFAAVYKWVDDKGKVHYSDRAVKSDQAEEVQLTPLNTMDGGRELAESAARYRREASEAETETSSQPNHQVQQDPCKSDMAMYRAFTEQQYSRNGRPKRYYLDNEDGSSMTEKEQADKIRNLGEDLKARGCL